jgi:hypothetical protein
MKLRPLRIHQQHAVIAGQHADVAPEALEHMYAVPEVVILDRRFVPIG